MSSVDTEIEGVLSEGLSELEGVSSPEGLEAFRVKFLSAKGKVSALMPLLGKASKEEKPALGQKINGVKGKLTEGYEGKKAGFASAPVTLAGIDITEPGIRPAIGRRHI